MRALLVILLLIATPVFAVQPDEILDDPALEARARVITADLRCVVCRNESVDDSNAEIARDIRLMVRERLVAGDSNAEAIQYMVDRYGEFILLNPRITGTNLLLWLAGPALLLTGLLVAVISLRRRRVTEEPLSEAEEARLAQLLDE
ncbi:cytochrome C biogenesis protein CcdA [Pararhodobacter oceanensis]|uniref:Cytochrome c-type biogenesis protein n=2 Tax=Pararhodobacter oceanensis TaxID=2172121 RepID=A0A2T8HTT4_9RHOB|nr:cytochrome C biogenesis protein CcdA [Pararhodobacter oceanensis]